MATNKRAFTMRMNHTNFEKIKFISDYNKRSIAMQIEFLIEQCVADFEKEHGKIQSDSSEKSTSNGSSL